MSAVLAVDLTSGYGVVLLIAGAYLFWAAVLDTSHRHYQWIKRRLRPERPSPQLDARVRKTGPVSHVLDIQNTGDVRVAQVEVEIPSEAFNWSLVTETLAAYPIPVLEPGDTQATVLVITMGQHASTEITLRGLVDGKPYERRRTVSVIGLG